MKYLIKIVLIILFIGCLFDMPYGYFQLVRYLGMIGFIALANFEYKVNKLKWIYVWIASAVLINPFVKISLGRDIWNVVDIVWCIILLISLFYQPKIK